MAEYIERTAAVKTVLRMRRPENSVAQNRMLSIIQMDISKLPAADVAPVVHGRWLCGEDYMFCSKCGMQWNYCDNDTQDFKYCPNCGAKMDGGDNDATDRC